MERGGPLGRRAANADEEVFNHEQNERLEKQTVKRQEADGQRAFVHKFDNTCAGGRVERHAGPARRPKAREDKHSGARPYSPAVFLGQGNVGYERKNVQLPAGRGYNRTRSRRRHNRVVLRCADLARAGRGNNSEELSKACEWGVRHVVAQRSGYAGDSRHNGNRGAGNEDVDPGRGGHEGFPGRFSRRAVVLSGVGVDGYGLSAAVPHNLLDLPRSSRHGPGLEDTGADFDQHRHAPLFCFYIPDSHRHRVDRAPAGFVHPLLLPSRGVATQIPLAAPRALRGPRPSPATRSYKQLYF